MVGEVSRQLSKAERALNHKDKETVIPEESFLISSTVLALKNILPE